MASNVQSKLLLEAAQRYAQAINQETLAVLEERGISELVAAKYQIGTIVEPANGHEMYVGWISIPYITAGGHCVGFKFRRLDEGMSKELIEVNNAIDVKELKWLELSELV